MVEEASEYEGDDADKLLEEMSDDEIDGLFDLLGFRRKE